MIKSSKQNNFQNFAKKLWKLRSTRFLFVGGLTALANILLVTLLINFFDLNTPLMRSLANGFATEICLLLSFFCYRQFVWQIETMNWSDVLRRELPIYHLSVSWIITIRIFLLFPLLDWLGLHHALNTMIGIALGAVLSYHLSKKFVFIRK